MSDQLILTLDNAEVRYANGIALQQVNLRIYHGEKIALIGRSGSGKSTLLRLIYEHLPNDTALIPQDDGLVDNLSVFHNVYMGRLSKHPAWYNLLNLLKPFTARIAEVEVILKQLKLTEKCFTPVAELSGGQRQRTAIARALYQSGDLLLADEPVSAIDEHQSHEIMTALAQQFPTLVVALHDTSLALAYCDRVIALDSGHIVQDSKADTVNQDQLNELYGDEPLA